MSWTDILRKKFIYNTPKADAVKPSMSMESIAGRNQETNWKDKLTPQVQAKIAADKKRFGETVASVPRKELTGRAPPKLNYKSPIKQEILDREQKKLDEAFAERQRELQTQRSSANNAKIDQINANIETAKKDMQIVMSKLKQAQATKHQNLADALDKIKMENIKAKLKEAGLTNELAQVEAIEQMALY